MSVNYVAEKIGMSARGFRFAIERETLPIKKIREMCALIGITPAAFFEKKNLFTVWDYIAMPVNQQNVVNNHQHAANDVEFLKQQIDALQQQLKEKDEQIRLLLDLLKRNSNETNGAK